MGDKRKVFVPAGTVSMNMHAGKNLLILAKHYANLLSVAKELVQNALDAGASEIFVFVDYEKRRMVVRDNGCGMSIEGFTKAMSSVCSSIKEVGKLGQFGLGFICPLGKCKQLIITSAAQAETYEYHRWSLDCHSILSSASLPEIPYEALPNYIFSRTLINSVNKVGVNWRTEVALQDFVRDSRISNIVIGELRSSILSQYSEAMKKNDTTITVRIKRGKEEPEQMTFKAAQFKGDKMPPVEYGDLKAGKTVFEMWVSPKTGKGRKGKIVVGLKGNDFRIEMGVFARSIQGIVSSETISCLLSGTFEGQIINDKCVLSENRLQFVDDDFQLEMCLHLDAWVKNHGNKVLAGIKDEQRDQWLQAVGSLALADLEAALKDSSLEHLSEVVKRFAVGSIGNGHKGFSSLSDHEQDEKSRVAHALSRYRIPIEKKPTLPKVEPKKEHTGHMPMTVVGPKGSHRKMVHGSSTGISFAYEEMPGVEDHWVFDRETGALTFNTRSDCWEKMERDGERNLILYQEYIAIKALELELVPEYSYDTVFEYLQRELKTAIIFIARSSSFHPRKAQSEVGKKI